jgi:hypothetical protein
MKCWACKQDIKNPEIELYKEPKYDRKGNVKLNSKGQQEYYNFHINCWEHKQKEKQGFNNLYDYILEKYFIKMLPTSLIKSLRELRQYYDFELMLECLQSLESNLMMNIDRIGQFNSDYQKGNYIMAALKNSIDSFYSKNLKKEKEKINIHQDTEFKFLNNNAIKKSDGIENYDILD